MRINHNIAALNTLRQLSSNNNATQSSLEKLSSGLRINSAADDAAGLAISEKMRGQIRGLDTAQRNAQDGISLIQTAEGALNETTSILQRMRELAVQASNDTTTDDDRANIQKEVNQLTDEINRIGNSTEFNTKKLINGDVSTNVSEGAKLVGNDLGDSIEIIGNATSGTATGTAIAGAIDIHAATAGKATAASVVDDGSSTFTVADGENELTLTIDGTQKTIALTVGDAYDFAGSGASDLVGDLNTALGGDATAGWDAGKLVITSASTGKDSMVKIDGGGLYNALFDTTPGAVPSDNSVVYNNGTVANNVLDFKVDGATSSITLDTNYSFNSVDDLVLALNGDATKGFVSGTGDYANVTWSTDGNALVATSNSTGSVSKVTDFGGSAAAALKLQGAATETGQDQNNTFQIEVDGEQVTATLQEGTYTDMDVFAAAVQSAINSGLSATGLSVQVSQSNGNLSIEDNKTGSTSSITITDGSGATDEQIAGAKALGFTSDDATDTSDVGIDGSDKALKMQIGANEGQETAISINDMRAAALGITSTNTSKEAVTAHDGSVLDVEYSGNTVDNNGNTEYVIDVTSHEAASEAISVIDNAVSTVSSERAKLGAYQNRLEHTINNLGTSSQNLTSAESRIRDVDMAKEMMEFTKNNILNQAAQAMLAKANQQPQGVLQLLR